MPILVSSDLEEDSVPASFLTPVVASYIYIKYQSLRISKQHFAHYLHLHA